MRKIFNVIGITLGIIFIVIPLVVVASPVILLVVIGILLFNGSEGVWKRLRRDPAVPLQIKRTRFTGNAEPSIGDYEQQLKEICTLICEASGSKLHGYVHQNEQPGTAIDNVQNNQTVLLVGNLESKYAKLALEVVLTSVYNVKRGRAYVYTDGEADDVDTAPIYCRLVKPSLQTERKFYIYDDADIWFVIALLRDDVKYTLDNGQAWAYLKEHDVWLVQYKINGNIYGHRQKLSNAKARQFWFDKPAIVASAN